MPPVLAKLIRSNCQPKKDGVHIMLKVTVGNAQLNQASYEIRQSVNGPVIQQGNLQDGVTLDLGPGTNLVGTRLSVIVTVVATTTVDTNLELEVTGGVWDLRFSNQTKADGIGDVVIYEAYIRFIK